MWLFMYACYLLSVASLFLLVLTGIQGYFDLMPAGISHPTLAIMTILVYSFTQTLVMFFFVGTGVSIKEYVQEHEESTEYHRRSIEVKRKLYPPTMLNILLVGVAFILGGAVHTNHVPGWVHGTSFWLAFLHYVKTLYVQHGCFKENTQIVLDMAGVERAKG